MCHKGVISCYNSNHEKILDSSEVEGSPTTQALDYIPMFYTHNEFALGISLPHIEENSITHDKNKIAEWNDTTNQKQKEPVNCFYLDVEKLVNIQLHENFRYQYEKQWLLFMPHITITGEAEKYKDPISKDFSLNFYSSSQLLLPSTAWRLYFDLQKISEKLQTTKSFEIDFSVEEVYLQESDFKDIFFIKEGLFNGLSDYFQQTILDHPRPLSTISLCNNFQLHHKEYFKKVDEFLNKMKKDEALQKNLILYIDNFHIGKNLVTLSDFFEYPKLPDSYNKIINDIFTIEDIKCAVKEKSIEMQACNMSLIEVSRYDFFKYCLFQTLKEWLDRYVRDIIKSLLKMRPINIKLNVVTINSQISIEVMKPKTLQGVSNLYAGNIPYGIGHLFPKNILQAQNDTYRAKHFKIFSLEPPEHFYFDVEMFSKLSQETEKMEDIQKKYNQFLKNAYFHHAEIENAIESVKEVREKHFKDTDCIHKGVERIATNMQNIQNQLNNQDTLIEETNSMFNEKLDNMSTLVSSNKIYVELCITKMDIQNNPCQCLKYIYDRIYRASESKDIKKAAFIYLQKLDNKKPFQIHNALHKEELLQKKEKIIENQENEENRKSKNASVSRVWRYAQDVLMREKLYCFIPPKNEQHDSKKILDGLSTEFLKKYNIIISKK